MKKSYETNDLKFGAQETRTEQFLTPDGVASLKTEKSSGAVIIENEIDPNSLNPVTGAAVAKAVAGASGKDPDVVAGENNNLVVKGTTNLNYKLTGHGPMGFKNLEYVDYDYLQNSTFLYLKFANPAHQSLSAQGDTSAQATVTVSPAITMAWDGAQLNMVAAFYAPNDGSITGSNMPGTNFWTGSSNMNEMDTSSNPKTTTMSGTATFLGANPVPSQFGEYVAIGFSGIKNEEQIATLVEAARNGNITLNWPVGYTSQDADLVCASAPTGSDQNKVLTVTSNTGELGWRDVPAPAYNPAVYDYGSDASAFMTALLANWNAGKPMMLRVPVSSFSTLASGRQFRTGGSLFLPLVSVMGTGLTITATFALTDGLEIFSAKFVIDEDEPAWEGVHSELDQ